MSSQGVSMRLLSWEDFDRAVWHIASSCDEGSISGIYGIPRGGLCLAVALSHRLQLPLLPRAQPGCLLVDDVYETGLTLQVYRDLPNTRAVVWISKANPNWWHAVEVVDSSEWIVFPWESVTAASADELLYRASRGGSPC
jgi:hypoxanthine phosphoribosyltransferase